MYWVALVVPRLAFFFFFGFLKVQFINRKCLALYSLSVLPLRLSSLSEVTSKITVSSCGVKLQEVLSGLEKRAKALEIHMHFCDFSQHSFFPLFHWDV